jgi:hypothetical protein
LRLRTHHDHLLHDCQLKRDVLTPMFRRIHCQMKIVQFYHSKVAFLLSRPHWQLCTHKFKIPASREVILFRQMSHTFHWLAWWAPTFIYIYIYISATHTKELFFHQVCYIYLDVLRLEFDSFVMLSKYSLLLEYKTFSIYTCHGT